MTDKPQVQVERSLAAGRDRPCPISVEQNLVDTGPGGSLEHAMSTTTVQIDSDLLARLRKRSPGRTDRDLLEDLATVTLGFETIRRVQRRTAEAGVDQQAIEDEAVRVVREHRRKRAAGQTAP